MRFSTLAAACHAACLAACLVACLATPSFAATTRKHEMIDTEATAEAPDFDDCFRLAWVRGVHVERFELDDFNAECLAGHVPFESGMAVDSVKRDVHGRAPHS